LLLSFPVHHALLVSIVITISIRSRVHNESLLQKVTDGNAKGLVQDHLDGVWSPSHIAELLKQILYLVMLFLQGVEMSVASTRRSL
jgi:hypothetical protein